MSTGTKYDDGKLPLHLLPKPALEEVAKVLGYGRAKYTSVKIDELKTWILTSIPVDIKELSGASGSTVVALVMNASCVKEIRPLQNGSVKTAEIGVHDTQLRLKRRSAPIGNNRIENNELTNLVTSKSTELQKLTLSGFWKNKAVSALCVEKLQSAFIQTMTILPDGSEESFVVGATTVSGFLTTLLRALNERQIISAEQVIKYGKDLRVRSEETFLYTGEWNWTKGFAWSRLSAAATRHLWAWENGADLDPESELPHLAHSICCLLFLLSHTLHALGEDDRHRFSKGGSQCPSARISEPSLPVSERIGSPYGDPSEKASSTRPVVVALPTHPSQAWPANSDWTGMNWPGA